MRVDAEPTLDHGVKRHGQPLEAVRRHATAVADGDHRPVLDELRSIVTGEDLLFLADLSISPTLAQLTTDS